MKESKAATEKPKKLKGKSRWFTVFAIIFLFVLFAAVAYTLVMAHLTPVKKIEELTKAALFSESESENFAPITDTSLLNLMKKEAFLKSRLAMAAQDSVYLVVNLPDSIVTLEIQGVTVHVARISQISKSGMLDRIDPRILITRFSAPQNIDSVEATIPKFVFTHKEAPADTSQQTQLVIPDTATIEPAYIKMFLRDDFILAFREKGDQNKKVLDKFVRNIQWNNSIDFLKSITGFKVPDYTPWIEVRIPARDIRTIYRSIPEKALLTIRM